MVFVVVPSTQVMYPVANNGQSNSIPKGYIAARFPTTMSVIS